MVNSRRSAKDLPQKHLNLAGPTQAQEQTTDYMQGQSRLNTGIKTLVMGTLFGPVRQPAPKKLIDLLRIYCQSPKEHLY